MRPASPLSTGSTTAPRGAPAEVVEEPGAQQRACPWALPRPFPVHARCIHALARVAAVR